MTVSEDAHISENAFQEAEPFTVSSPAPSNLSIERYLASSPDEEMASPEAIEANIQAALEENSALERNTFKSPNLTAAGSVCAEVTEEPLNVPTTFKYLTDSLLDHRANAWKNALSKYTTLPSQVDVDDTTADIHSESLLRDQRETSSQSMMGDANSDTTNGSCMSLVSNASFVSMDSRGSRRGRRRWNRPPGSQKTQNLDGTAGPIPGAAHNLYQHKLQFHCTFPGCGRIFDNEYEWNRHEYSIHYPQIEWICCKNLDIDALLYRALLECSLYSLDFEKFRTCLQKFINYEFAGCKHEIEADRTFFRKDQFIQHLNICHLKHFPNACFQEDFFEDDEQKKLILNGLRKVFAETWERLKAYPSAEAAGLYCSACSQTLNSWEERKSHFSRHFKDGIHVWSSPIDAQRECTVFVPLIRKVSTGYVQCVNLNSSYSLIIERPHLLVPGAEKHSLHIE
jgi:hypothetical protein